MCEVRKQRRAEYEEWVWTDKEEEEKDLCKYLKRHKKYGVQYIGDGDRKTYTKVIKVTVYTESVVTK